MFPPNLTSRPAGRMGGAPSPAPADVREPTPRRSWRERVRSAVDLTVAFALLEDAHPAPEPPDPSERDDPRSARVSVGAVHAHRKPLRPMPRPRRPGAVPARAQVCTSPVGHTPPAPPKRRARE
jgi:hypothetical protein